MWRNADVLDFVGWLRTHNDGAAGRASAPASTASTCTASAPRWRPCSDICDKVDPEAARRARQRYACFDQFGEEPQAYGYAASVRAAPLVRAGGRRAARRSAPAAGGLREPRRPRRRRRILLRGAERAPRRGTPRRTTARCSAGAPNRGTCATGTWSTRSMSCCSSRARWRAGARVVVWAHNSHLGDARATEMGERGELNVGQLVREQYGARRRARRLHDLHRHGDGRVGLGRSGGPQARAAGAARQLRTAVSRGRARRDSCCRCAPISIWRRRLTAPRLERAIGVLYLPETERASHYFHARLPEQFDFVLHFDETRAVEPLERNALWEAGEVAETFPRACEHRPPRPNVQRFLVSSSPASPFCPGATTEQTGRRAERRRKP